MQHDNSDRSLRAADFCDSTATEFSIAADKFEREGNQLVADGLRVQARMCRTEAIRLRAVAAGDACFRVTRRDPDPK